MDNSLADIRSFPIPRAQDSSNRSYMEWFVLFYRHILYLSVPHMQDTDSTQFPDLYTNGPGDHPRPASKAWCHPMQRSLHYRFPRFHLSRPFRWKYLLLLPEAPLQLRLLCFQKYGFVQTIPVFHMDQKDKIRNLPLHFQPNHANGLYYTSRRKHLSGH